MPGREEWRNDIADALKSERWRLSGANRPVKVVPLNRPLTSRVGGYFTVAAYLHNRTPAEMETDLGLPSGFLRWGARIDPFLRLPNYSEYAYELTAAYPDGLTFIPWSSDPNYPPGSPIIHQWRLLAGCSIPVDPQHYIAVRPGQRFDAGDV
jgi:hypothetical protein